MPTKYSTVTLRPKMGGQLVTNVSTDESGLFNYSEKREWRRYLERELRREGNDYFVPNTTIPVGTQPFPTNVPVDLTPPGNYGITADTIVTKTGYTYRWVKGDHEVSLTNGSSVYTVSTDFQADGESVLVTQTLNLIPRTYQLIEYDPINLIHMARRPNGKTAVIVGTPTTLYRYFGLEDGAYYDLAPDGFPYFQNSPAPDAPYYDDNTGEWITIGTGFSMEGQRWEAVSINGWSVFNNGVDLPVSYRVEDQEVVPLYELRESGIASVGCIAELTGILMLFDISEIQDEPLTELFDPLGVRRSGAIMASVSANVVRATSDFFTNADVGRTVVFDDGTARDITGNLTASTMTVSGSTDPTPLQRFKLQTKAVQPGSSYSDLTTASQASASFNIVSSVAIFLPGDVGKLFRYINGWSAVITIVTDNQHITVDTAAPVAFTTMPFFLVSQPDFASADWIVTTPADVFDVTMEGKLISWDDGTQRRIVTFIDARNVYVDSDYSIDSDLIGIENPDTYLAYTRKEFINRIQYRTMWSMPELPRRFSPIYLGSMAAGERTLKLTAEAKSIEIGDQLVVVGAGASGGNLTANVAFISANRVIALDETAETDVIEAPVQKEDAVSSIVGYEDLQDDSSAIIKALELQGEMVIYKDTAIVFAKYTGNVAQPFTFSLKRVPSTYGLFYKNTLIGVNGSSHLYAGRNSFYRLDLVNRFPTTDNVLELAKDLFFNNARLTDSRWIFSADNIITKEIFLVTYPYLAANPDKVLCLDYQQNTVSTTNIVISAACSVKRPESTVSTGPVEDWFVMGTPSGTVLLYGAVSVPDSSLQPSPSRQIWYRRDNNPYSATKSGYQGRLTSCLSDFNAPFVEKDIRSLVLLLSTMSPNAPVTWDLLDTRNTNEPAIVKASKVFATPNSKNLFPVFFRQNYFAHRVTIDGLDNPLEIEAVILEVSGVNSKSVIRNDV